jgi:hypothetical protein
MCDLAQLRGRDQPSVNAHAGVKVESTARVVEVDLTMFTL